MDYQIVFNAFFDKFLESINQGVFSKLTLAKTIGNTELKNIYVHLSITPDQSYQFEITERYKTQEIQKFYTQEQLYENLAFYIKNPFQTFVLFTTEMDLTFKVNKKNAGSLIEQDPTFKNPSIVMLEMIQKGIIKL